MNDWNDQHTYIVAVQNGSPAPQYVRLELVDDPGEATPINGGRFNVAQSLATVTRYLLGESVETDAVPVPELHDRQ